VTIFYARVARGILRPSDFSPDPKGFRKPLGSGKRAPFSDCANPLKRIQRLNQGQKKQYAPRNVQGLLYFFERL
jgi:hypothetical protein